MNCFEFSSILQSYRHLDMRSWMWNMDIMVAVITHTLTHQEILDSLDDSQYSHILSKITANFINIFFSLIRTYRPFFTHHLSDINDRTPLLNSPNRLRPTYIDVRVFTLGILFIGGITVGIYMLYQLDRPWPMTKEGVLLDFVNREDWGAAQLPTGNQLFSNNVFHVLLYHTATENCYNLSDCKEFVYNYQVLNRFLLLYKILFSYLFVIYLL